MTDAHRRHTLRRGAWEITRSAQSHLHEGHVVPTFAKQICDAKLLRFCHAPGRQEFPTNPIFELRFSLEDEDARSGLGHGHGQCRTSKATAHGHDVVVRGRHATLHGASLTARRADPTLRMGGSTSDVLTHESSSPGNPRCPKEMFPRATGAPSLEMDP